MHDSKFIDDVTASSSMEIAALLNSKLLILDQAKNILFKSTGVSSHPRLWRNQWTYYLMIEKRPNFYKLSPMLHKTREKREGEDEEKNEFEEFTMM